MASQTATKNTDVSLALEFQKHSSNKSRKNGIFDDVKHKKYQWKKNWTNIEYNVQHNKYAEHQGVKIYCATNHFPSLNFFWTHDKPHGVRGLGNHYHVCSDKN